MTQPHQPNDWWQPPATSEAQERAFEPLSPARRRRRPNKSWLIGGGAVVVAACVAVVWLVMPFGTVVLDDTSVQKQVIRVLRTSYGERAASDARCPADEPVEAGHTFTCTVTIDGTEKSVQIRVLNEKPVFTVGAPH